MQTSRKVYNIVIVGCDESAIDGVAIPAATQYIHLYVYVRE